MSLYDKDDPQALEYLAFHRSRWTPEKEAGLQHKFALQGLNGPEAQATAEAVERAKAAAS